MLVESEEELDEVGIRVTARREILRIESGENYEEFVDYRELQCYEYVV